MNRIILLLLIGLAGCCNKDHVYIEPIKLSVDSISLIKSSKEIVFSDSILYKTHDNKLYVSLSTWMIPENTEITIVKATEKENILSIYLKFESNTPTELCQHKCNFIITDLNYGTYTVHFNNNQYTYYEHELVFSENTDYHVKVSN